MGSFSWMYADSGNTKALNIGRKAYVPCPDGTVLYIRKYDGNGCFADRDIYELVVDWNKDYLSIDDISPKGLSAEWDERNRRILTDFISGKSPEYMESVYGESWKRLIGICIACDDKDNASLKYPIKICENLPPDYDTLPPSKSDPNQGFGKRR